MEGREGDNGASEKKSYTRRRKMMKGTRKVCEVGGYKMLYKEKGEWVITDRCTKEGRAR